MGLSRAIFVLFWQTRYLKNSRVFGPRHKKKLWKSLCQKIVDHTFLFLSFSLCQGNCVCQSPIKTGPNENFSRNFFFFSPLFTKNLLSRKKMFFPVREKRRFTQSSIRSSVETQTDFFLFSHRIFRNSLKKFQSQHKQLDKPCPRFLETSIKLWRPNRFPAIANKKKRITDSSALLQKKVFLLLSPKLKAHFGAPRSPTRNL
jgi:hypothetical protein